ncbi:MAG: SPOR domain-containing protein [Bacteroidetes bacterium]|nr:SPOR domain-containing protein [Bacteroidota bacterium]
MIKGIKIILLFFLITTVSYSQTDETVVADSISAHSSNIKSTNEFIFKPAIGLGTGMFSFYGDLYSNHFQAPMVSRIGYELNVSQRFTDYLQFNFYTLFGKLGANERFSPDNRNLNFESQIRVGGLNLLYNFDNFLPSKRDASPYISLGFESFEFLSKTDILDKNGNKYYYWSDGSTRNIDENASNANMAVEIQRDYTYESDIRTMNLDGFGKYPERSWAIPVGIGAVFNMNDFWSLKIGTTMHFTFTDNIDGVSNKSVGNRVGNKGNDNFMMTSVSLHYNFGMKDKEAEEMEEDNFKDVDFFALDLSDLDKDGVPDAKDSCQGTPEGVPVDAKGCPLDDDKDNVPNFKDDELDSPKDAFVDIKGVQLNDSIIDYQYRFYMDSTGAFATVVRHDHNGKDMYNNLFQKEYSVEIGKFSKGLPPELMTKYLSIGDISSTNIDDSTTIYTAGKFNSLLDAEIRKKQLISDGLTNAKVIYKQNGKLYDAPAYIATNNVANNNNNKTANNTTNNTTTNNNANNTNNSNTANNTTNNTTTNNVNNTNNNNNANNTTNNTTTNNNANNINNNTTNNTTNNNTANNNTNNNTSHTSNTNPATNSKGIVLRVQLGAYKNRLSKNVFKDINDLIEIKTNDGLYKYMTGSFTTFDAAAKHKVEMLLKGYQGAFITAYKDGKRVTLKEAGATPQKKDDITESSSDNAEVNGVNKKLVTFKVQVGVFKSEPPADKQAKFEKVKGITKEVTATGLNRYTVGPFSDYTAAQNAKNDLMKNIGIEDAFILAFFNGEYITIQEALELLKN